MNVQLTMEEQQFLQEVLAELEELRVGSKERAIVKEQLLEHFQEAHEHGDDSIYRLGDPSTFVQDFLEINGINIQSNTKQTKPKSVRLTVIGFLTFVATYIISQLCFSLFLTDSFSQERDPTLQYNLFYNISSNTWWNGLLILISITISVILTILAIYYTRKSLHK
ncbi:hypothetical protein [Paucisalibacillus sp. EB02]|uniref:hypothetical protein n=1 Tax=Paucisalibacillus sp. EB02 TaxID=1347087 RepID=UPI0004B18C1B|nr:hypothetical protein [Paucisalibacillus sp. EB02]